MVWYEREGKERKGGEERLDERYLAVFIKINNNDKRRK